MTDLNVVASGHQSFTLNGHVDCVTAVTFMVKYAGPSTGTNLVGVLQLMQGMQAQGQTGSIVSLICDGGDRYAHPYDDAWVNERYGIGLDQCQAQWLG